MKNTTQQLFDSFKPDLGDKDRYIEEISKKLDAVETLHKFCEDNARQTRRSLVLAGLTGLLVGGIIMAIVLLCPLSSIDLSIKLGIRVLAFSIHYSIILSIILAAIPIIIFVFLNVSQQSELH